MKLTILTIGAAALGILAMTGPTRALPAAQLGPAVNAASDVQPVHYSRYRHLHRHGHVYYRPGQGRYAAEERLRTGRSAIERPRGGKYRYEQYGPRRGGGY